MSCENCSVEDCLVQELCNHIDEVVTIYTDSCCFTGLLVAIESFIVKIITKRNYGCPGHNLFGKTTLILVREIEAVSFCNTSIQRY